MLGIFCAVLGAGLLVGGVAFPFIAPPTSVPDEILFAVCGLFFSWAAICAFRGGVQVSGGKLVIYNELFTRRVDAGDIRTITLEPKAVSKVVTRWVARVELTSGKSIWIEDFDCGTASKPPIPEQVAIVDQVRALLGVRADDIEQPEPAGGEGLHFRPG
jgi:hypothetical protein